MYLTSVKNILNEVGVSFVDLSEMFSLEDNPFDSYAPVHHYYGHFNEKGAKKAFLYLSHFW